MRRRSSTWPPDRALSGVDRTAGDAAHRITSRITHPPDGIRSSATARSMPWLRSAATRFRRPAPQRALLGGGAVAIAPGPSDRRPAAFAGAAICTLALMAALARSRRLTASGAAVSRATDALAL